MATNGTAAPHDSVLRDSAALRRNRSWRRIKDKIARLVVVSGGLAVIAALLLIFAYLFYVVLPLFQPAAVEPVAEYALPADAGSATLGLAMQEHAEIAARFTADAVSFFRTASGETVERIALPLPPGVRVTSYAAGDPQDRAVVYGLSDGRALVVRHDYALSFPDGKRVITPQLEFPLGEQPVEVGPAGQPLQRVALQLNESGASIVGLGADGSLSMARYQRKKSFLTDEVSWRGELVALPRPKGKVERMLLNPLQDVLYLVENNRELSLVDLRDPSAPEILQRVKLVGDHDRVSALSFLAGGISLLVGTDSGRIVQWFPVRDADNNPRLTRVREFDSQRAAITAIASEQARKGFAAADASGKVGIYHATAHRTLKVKQLADGRISQLAMAPRANAILLQQADGSIEFAQVRNEHPEVSWAALWGSVWYEGYAEPRQQWQSSAANSDFEPKFSLAPLSFGTLKAAAYAMLFSVPLAIMGAIFTAYFMSPTMRKFVKPTVEIMEALPTVILGFLAGLWLAPLAEQYLPGFFAMFALVPLGVLAFAYLWSRLPLAVRARVPEGWTPALLIPVIVLLASFAFWLSPLMEEAFFGGNVRLWMTHEMGIDFDQRNAFVVGMAMGFAVIPTIFSIAEDAIFSVPKHLSFGALALGSTPWQALTRVVLLTASPGIFSAVMIGLGRAVGETMIVLMATGNTPVMDWSIFSGMRTLSANIAVEMPESAVGSTHYRVLFLAGLVLFVFTFFVNTIAELVRQRLRGKYSSL